MNKFFFGYLSFAWKRLSRSIVYILLIINAFYVQHYTIEFFYIESLPFEELIYEYQSFINYELFGWLNDGVEYLFNVIGLGYTGFSYFITNFFTSSIPLILTTAFLSWIIMPFVVKEN